MAQLYLEGPYRGLRTKGAGLWLAGVRAGEEVKAASAPRAAYQVEKMLIPRVRPWTHGESCEEAYCWELKH